MRRRGCARWLVLAVLLVLVAGLSVGQPNPFEVIRGPDFQPPRHEQPRPRGQEHIDAALQSQLDRAVDVSSGSLGAAVIDLEGGGEAAHDRDPSSVRKLVKLPILVEVLAQQEEVHRLDPDQLLDDPQTTGPTAAASSRRASATNSRCASLTRLMIQDSDNIAALVLFDAVGASNVNATLDERLGLHDARVVDRRSGEAGEHVTTARDTARLLSIVPGGQLIDATVSEQALRLLEQPQAHTWLADSSLRGPGGSRAQVG